MSFGNSEHDRDHPKSVRGSLNRVCPFHEFELKFRVRVSSKNIEFELNGIVTTFSQR